jgi:hypothetical protein
MTPDESVQSFSSRVDDALWSVKAMCPDLFTIDAFDEELETIALLQGASDTYQELTTALLAQDTLTKAKVTTAFKNEELHHMASPDTSLSATALKTSTPLMSTLPILACDFCGANGHIQAGCHHFKAAKNKAHEECSTCTKSHQKPNANVASTEQPKEVARSASLHSSTSLSLASDSWNENTGATSHI